MKQSSLFPTKSIPPSVKRYRVGTMRVPVRLDGEEDGASITRDDFLYVHYAYWHDADKSTWCSEITGVYMPWRCEMITHAKAVQLFHQVQPIRARLMWILTQRYAKRSTAILDHEHPRATRGT